MVGQLWVVVLIGRAMLFYLSPEPCPDWDTYEGRLFMHINSKLSSYFSQLPSYLQMVAAAGVVLAGSLLPLTVFRAEAQSGSTYYVSTTGSDANSGTQNSPWASITHASTEVAPGDTVVVQDGTYYLAPGGSVNGTPAGDWAISSNGAPGQPITYIAAHKWQAKLIGQGTGDGSRVIGMQGGYNILENFDITGSDATGVILATTFGTNSYNQAIGNYVHDIMAPCDDNGGGGLNSGAGGSYLVTNENFIGNLVVNITNAGGSSCPYNTTYGIYEAVAYGIVANNVIINANYAIQSWHAAAHLTIFGNTEINSRIGVVVGAGDAPGTTNDYTLVQNNIAVNNSVTGIHEEDYTGTHNLYIDNVGYQNATDLVLQNGLTCSGCIHADPLFVNNTGTAAGNYCLQSNTPAVGLALAGILTDFYGQSRPQTGATVMGACIGAGSTSSAVAAGIRASATTVASGHGVTLTWTTNNAVIANLNGTPVTLTGWVVAYPRTTTAYRVTAYSASGASDEGTVNVTVVAAGIRASSTTVASGQPVTLTWTTQGAVSADLNGTNVPLNGSLVVYPTATTAYRITAHSSSGVTDEGTVNVTVSSSSLTGSAGATSRSTATAPHVAAGIRASSVTIAPGGSTTLTWTTQGAMSADLNGTTVPLNGSLVVSPTVTTAYRLTAHGTSGSTDEGTVNVTVD